MVRRGSEERPRRVPRDTDPQRGYLPKQGSRNYRGGGPNYKGRPHKGRKSRTAAAALAAAVAERSSLFLPAIKPNHPVVAGPTPQPLPPLVSSPNIYYDFKPSEYGAPAAEPISDSYGNPATPTYGSAVVVSTTALPPVYTAAPTQPTSYVTSSYAPPPVVKTTAIYRSETGHNFKPGTVYQEPTKVS